jgi:hypothetical protein
MQSYFGMQCVGHFGWLLKYHHFTNNQLGASPNCPDTIADMAEISGFPAARLGRGLRSGGMHNNI